MKKILVTGGAGFIGYNLVKRLVDEGNEVHVVDNFSSGLEDNVISGAKYHRYDIRTINSYDFIGTDVDSVYHLAAIARIQPSFADPINYFETNASATLKIAHWCAVNDIPMVYAGSSSHHSGKFKNPYTFSKDVGEEAMKLAREIYGLTASVARFYNVYGPHHLKEGGYCTVIGKWERAIENGEPITVYGDGTKTRDFTHVDDIVDALIRIVDQNVWNTIFELGRGQSYSIKEVAEMFDPVTGIIHEDDKPGEALDTLCDTRYAKTMLGWNPTKNLEEWIKNESDILKDR